MTIELINGKAGTPHIDGNDIGIINQATRGAGSYVLEYGDSFAATVSDSNHVSIGTGCASFEGRDVIISSAETVTLSSGSQGMYRIDYICLYYHRDTSSNVESMELVVLQGTSTSSQSAVTGPTVPSGSILEGATDAYWPLYQVSLDGISVGDPEPLFDTLSAESTYRSTVQPKLLWSGSWSSGSITVDGLNDYCYFAARMTSSTTTLGPYMSGFSRANETTFHLQTTYVNTNGNYRAVVLSASRDGETLTMNRNTTGLVNPSANTINTSNLYVVNIFGVAPIGLVADV